MPRQRHSAEQIVTKLRQIEVLVAQGRTIGQACKEAEITEQSYYRWRNEYGGLEIEQAKRFEELERENARLKRLVADLSLEKQILKDVAEGGYPAYTAAKAAVHGITRGLARDFGPQNVRVNTVVPGWVMTKRQVELWLDADGERQIQENQCLKEKLYPPDIERMVLFLVADDSRLCTAQNFVVDAGWT